MARRLFVRRGWRVKIGKKRHRIEIQEEISTEQDAHGNIVPQWQTIGTVWANLVPISGKENLQGGTIGADASHRVEIRYFPRLKPSMRIRYGVRLFDINGIVNDRELNKDHILSCTETVAT